MKLPGALSQDETELQLGFKEQLAEREVAGKLRIYVQHEEHTLVKWLAISDRGMEFPAILELEAPGRFHGCCSAFVASSGLLFLC